MKRKALKGLNWMGYYVASFGCGYLFGKLIGKIFSRVLTDHQRSFASRQHPSAHG